jgi:hypothetical protein
VGELGLAYQQGLQLSQAPADPLDVRHVFRQRVRVQERVRQALLHGQAGDLPPCASHREPLIGRRIEHP